MPVNVIAPYLLTALLHRSAPTRLPEQQLALRRTRVIDRVDWQGRRAGSYEDSKLFVTTFMAAVARLRPEVLSNAVDPGWVPTKMGGPGAPDDLDLGHRTQEWLAVSHDPRATVTGAYWYHGEQQRPHRSVNDQSFQDVLLRALATETGVSL